MNEDNIKNNSSEQEKSSKETKDSGIANDSAKNSKTADDPSKTIVFSRDARIEQTVPEQTGKEVVAPFSGQIKSKQKKPLNPPIWLLLVVFIVIAVILISLIISGSKKARVSTNGLTENSEPGTEETTSQPLIGEQISKQKLKKDEIIKTTITSADLMGIAPRQIKANGPVISEKSDPLIAALADALKKRVLLQKGSVKTQKGELNTEIISGAFRGFSIKSTRIMQAGIITKNEIIVFTPSKGVITIRNGLLDTMKRTSLDLISSDFKNSGINLIEVSLTADDPDFKIQFDVLDPVKNNQIDDFLIKNNSIGNIMLGQDIAAMMTLLSNKYNLIRKKIKFEDRYIFVHKAFNKKEKNLFYVYERNNKVLGIQITSTLFKTIRGIGIGSTLGTIRAYYNSIQICKSGQQPHYLILDQNKTKFFLQEGILNLKNGLLPDSSRVVSILIGELPDSRPN